MGSSLARFRQQDLLSLDRVTTRMAKAHLPQPGIPDSRIKELSWQEQFIQHLDSVENQYGQKALLLELKLWLKKIGYVDYADQQGLFIRRMQELLINSRLTPDDKDLGLGPKDSRRLKEAIVWAVEQFSPMRPAPLYRPTEERIPTEQEVKIRRWKLRIDEMSDSCLLRKLIFRLGSCDLSDYEYGYIRHNGLSLHYNDKWGWNFTFTPKQRKYAERLLIGDNKELPLIGILQRPLKLRLDLVRDFKRHVGTIDVLKEEDPMQLEMF